MTVRRNQLARFGESAAATFFERRGAAISGRNIRVGRDEIDLLVRWPDGSRAVVEVKTRTASQPIEAFGEIKARKTKRAARNLKPPVDRVDLCAIRVEPAGIDLHWIPNIV